MFKSKVKARAAELADRTEAAVDNIADEVRSQVGGLADFAASAVEDVYGQARKQVRGASTAVASSVQDSPLLVLLAVGLVSAVVGALLARR